MGARTAELHEIPSFAADLMTKATKAGWTVTASYAKGTTLTGHEAESVVLRFELPAAGARAVAVWVDGKFDVGFRWARWLQLDKIGARALGSWLREVIGTREVAA